MLRSHTGSRRIEYTGIWGTSTSIVFCLHTCVHDPHDVNAAPHNPRETVQARQTDREGEGEPGKGEGTTSEKRRETERERGERVRDREGRVSTERGERGRGQGQGIGEGHAGGGAGGGGVMKVLWLHEGVESSFCVAPFFLVFGVPGIIADILVPCCSRT